MPLREVEVAPLVCAARVRAETALEPLALAPPLCVPFVPQFPHGRGNSPGELTEI